MSVAQRPPITHVAIRYQDRVFSLPAPNRHHHVIRMIAEELGVSPPVGVSGERQGFLDASGQFLSRKEALEVALANGQVKDPTQIRAGRLFSEDVW